MVETESDRILRMVSQHDPQQERFRVSHMMSRMHVAPRAAASWTSRSVMARQWQMIIAPPPSHGVDTPGIGGSSTKLNIAFNKSVRQSAAVTDMRIL